MKEDPTVLQREHLSRRQEQSALKEKKMRRPCMNNSTN